jgi:hypothetical protein
MAVKKKTRQVIRNLHSVEVNLRLGSRKDPYYINLRRRGAPGDTHSVPVELTDHDQYERNVGRLFEPITADEYARLEYGTPEIRKVQGLAISNAEGTGDLVFTGIVKNSELSTTVATVDAQGNLTRAQQAPTTQEVTAPTRMKVPGTVDFNMPPDAAPPTPQVAADAGVVAKGVVRRKRSTS